MILQGTLLLSLVFSIGMQASAFIPQKISLQGNFKESYVFDAGQLVNLDLALKEIDPLMKGVHVEYGVAREIVNGQFTSFEPVKKLITQDPYADTGTTQVTLTVPNAFKEESASNYVFYAKTYVDNDPDTDSFIVSDSNFKIRINTTEELIKLKYATLVQSNGKEFPVLHSPTIYDLAKTEYKGVASSTSLRIGLESNFDTTLTPTLTFTKLRSDSPVGDFPLASISLKKGITKHSIDLPIFDYKPGVYKGKIDFKNKDLPDIEFQYTVAGDMVTFGQTQESVVDKTIVLNFDIFGTPIDFDLFENNPTAASSSPVNSTNNTEFIFKNASGKELYKVNKPVDFSTSTYSLSIPLNVKNIASVYVKTVDKNGATLYEGTKDLHIPYPKNNIKAVFVILLILLGILILLFVMKIKYRRSTIGMFMVLVGLLTLSIGSTVYSDTQYANGWNLKRPNYVTQSTINGVSYPDFGYNNELLLKSSYIRFSEDIRTADYPSQKDVKIIFRASAAVEAGSGSYLKIGFSPTSINKAMNNVQTIITTANIGTYDGVLADGEVDWILTSPYRQINLGKLTPNVVNNLYIYRAGKVLLTYSDSYKVPIQGVYLENTSQVITCPTPTEITTTGASVSWTYSDADSDPQTSYEVSVSKASNFSPIDKSVTPAAGTNVSGVRKVTLTGLAQGTKYYVHVRAKNAANDWGPGYATCGSGFTTKKDAVVGTTCSCNGTRTQTCTGSSPSVTANSPSCALGSSCIVTTGGNTTTFSVTPENRIGTLTYNHSPNISVQKANSLPYTWSTPKTAGVQSLTVNIVDSAGGSDTSSCSIDNSSSATTTTTATDVCGCEGTSYICRTDGVLHSTQLNSPICTTSSTSTPPGVKVTKDFSLSLNGSCKIDWKIQNMPDSASCVLTGGSLNEPVSGENSKTVKGLTANTKFTITCSGPTITPTISSSVICRVNPNIIEN